MQQQGENAHIHTKVYLKTGMNMSIGCLEHVDANRSTIGSLSKMLLVVFNQPMQEGFVCINA